MPIITSIANLFFRRRIGQIEYFKKHPCEVQDRQLEYLVANGAGTAIGREYGLKDIKSAEQFRSRIPVFDYETVRGYIEHARRAERDVLWGGEIKWFAKSSGTTDTKSKYIPVTDDGLRHNHMRGPIDCAAVYLASHPDSKVFYGKTLTLGGSHRIEREGEHAMTGDLSAILIENTPKIGRLMRVPSPKTALIPDFEQKVQAICRECADMDIRSFAGVPSWNLVMLKGILEYTGKSNISEVWPNLELFIHGGVNFSPYRELYKKIIPSPSMHYMETYNASEGFFGICDDLSRDDMLLMLDYHTYFEFLPLSQLGHYEKAVPLQDVRKGENYAMIITSSNGLWRYLIGDTVEFTDTDPYRIRITGRTKHYINAFGEEIIVDNAEKAIRRACEATGAQATEYTAAPIYMELGRKGAHQWLVEFDRMPDDMNRFAAVLDRQLQELNSDYEAKRYKDTTLYAPEITVVPRGTFMEWMRSRGKIGGQNKVPRLCNDRRYVDGLLETAAKKRQTADLK